MLSVANDHAAEFEAAQAACDRLLAEQADTVSQLAEAHSSASDGSPILGSLEGTRTAAGAIDAP